mmetsp:Transcript_26985/g.69838  ORF Transcript_26985/g.69838 Transcript_26985/m.69838 type:complete len:292 (+) Transcript_26985:2569-3444(+)
MVPDHPQPGLLRHVQCEAGGDQDAAGGGGHGDHGVVEGVVGGHVGPEPAGAGGQPGRRSVPTNHLGGQHRHDSQSGPSPNRQESALRHIPSHIRPHHAGATLPQASGRVLRPILGGSGGPVGQDGPDTTGGVPLGTSVGSGAIPRTRDSSHQRSAAPLPSLSKNTHQQPKPTVRKEARRHKSGLLQVPGLRSALAVHRQLASQYNSNTRQGPHLQRQHRVAVQLVSSQHHPGEERRLHGRANWEIPPILRRVQDPVLQNGAGAPSWLPNLDELRHHKQPSPGRGRQPAGHH